MDKKSYQNIGSYYIGYIRIKNIDDYDSIHIENPLYFIIGEDDGNVEERHGNKYLVFACTDKKRSIDKIGRTLESN